MRANRWAGLVTSFLHSELWEWEKGDLIRRVGELEDVLRLLVPAGEGKYFVILKDEDALVRAAVDEVSRSGERS